MTYLKTSIVNTKNALNRIDLESLAVLINILLRCLGPSKRIFFIAFILLPYHYHYFLPLCQGLGCTYLSVQHSPRSPSAKPADAHFLFIKPARSAGFSRIKKIPYQAPPTQLGPRKCTFWKKAFLGPKYQC